MGKRISKQATGGIIHDSLDARAMAVIEQLSDDEFLPLAIGRLVGRYKLDAEFRDTAPATADEIIHLEQTERAIKVLLDKLENVPEDFKAIASDDLLKVTGEHHDQVTERMNADLLRYSAICRKAIKTMKQWPASPGATPKQLEGKLLANVSDLLEQYCTGVEHAAEMASAVLRAEGIKNTPVDKKKARNAILKYKTP